jgi:hypothetical protein
MSTELKVVKQEDTKPVSKYTAKQQETLQRMQEAIPNWYAILYQGKDLDYSIQDYNRCIVGEWHGQDK